MEEYKFPKTFSVNFEVDIKQYTPLYAFEEQVHFSSPDDAFSFVEGIFYSFTYELGNFLDIPLSTAFLPSFKKDKRIYYDLEYDFISIDIRSFIFSSNYTLNTYLLMKSLCHELGHAIHHHISKQRERALSSTSSLFCSENIAQYSELVLAKFYSQWNPDYIKFNYAEYSKSVLAHFYKTFLSMMSGSEKHIDQIINVPLLPLNIQAIVDPIFLTECLYNGYRTYDELMDEISNYFQMKEHQHIYEL